MLKCNCPKCQNLFQGFNNAEPIETANPPREKGVYVIRIKKAGNSDRLSETLSSLKLFFEKTEWERLRTWVGRRVARLNNYKESDCDIIYIGCGGKQQKKQGSIFDRHDGFVTGHTVMYPLWILLYHGWKIDLGWRVDYNASQLENNLRHSYYDLHGRYPILDGN